MGFARPFLSRTEDREARRGATMAEWDVFLNHRGPDVKVDFVAHLHDALRCAGLNAFLDKESSTRGLPIESIMDVLKSAKVHVAVVSKGYADSKFCLSELVAIMESGKPVIPVFYDVEPSALRRVENGLFAEAFEKHKRRESEKQVEEWADALEKLANVIGFCFRRADYYGDEAKLKKKVVDAVKMMAPVRRRPLPMKGHLVGLEMSMSTCMLELEKMWDATCVLGLVGMGGIGKTTLAKLIFNYVVHKSMVRKSRFEAMSFVDVGGKSRKGVEVGLGSLERLQKQLLKDLLHIREKDEWNFEDGFFKLSSRGPILVVLDDIHDEGQFDELILDKELLPKGSCIIVTSRDRHLLKAVGRGCNFYLHEVSLLGFEDSEKLFNWHAFGCEKALESFEFLAKNVSKACGGLPLALKVMGCSLFDKVSDGDEPFWIEAVDVLWNNCDVMGVLRWSYNCLSEAEKSMFLNIACIFHGWKIGIVWEIWKSCKKCSSHCGCITPLTSLRLLMDKSLVEISHVGILVMHGLLQELGKAIGMANGSHLWDEKAQRALQDKYQGKKKVRLLNLTQGEKETIEAKKFAHLPNLHYLVLDGREVEGKFGSNLAELRMLQWRNMPSSHVSLTLNLLKLTSLDLSYSAKLAKLWTDSNPALEACPNLQRLNLTSCESITTLPSSIGQLSQLKSLNLRDCKNLEELPISVGKLTALEVLQLIRCQSLKTLPNTITTLSRLEDLYLAWCPAIQHLPTEMGLMTSLAYIDVSLLTERDTICLGQLGGLKCLRVRDCIDKAISALDYFGAFKYLDQLHWLYFDYCPFLTKLPNTIELLTNLKVLEVYGCFKFQELPESIGQLQVLEYVIFTKCWSLKTLPESFGRLSSLRHLHIIECPTFSMLPSSLGCLPRLEEMTLQGCTGLHSLSNSLRHLSTLAMFALLNCGDLRRLNLGNVLRGLRTWGCTRTTDFPGSFLIVRESNHVSKTLVHGLARFQWFPEGKMEIGRLETNECGFLQIVQDTQTGHVLVHRVHELSCTKDIDIIADTSISYEEYYDAREWSDDNSSELEFEDADYYDAQM